MKYYYFAVLCLFCCFNPSNGNSQNLITPFGTDYWWDTTLFVTPAPKPGTDFLRLIDTLCTPAGLHSAEICNNNIDDDGDGLFDCLDPECNCMEDKCAPKQGNIWYFGDKAGLDFNTDPPTVLTDGKTVNTATTTVSDINGKMLFYADGFYVYNRFNEQMPNSFDRGDFAIPHPGDKSIYYLLRQNPAGTGYSYHTLDLKLDNGKGDIVPGNPIPIIQPNGGNVNWPALTKSCNPEGYWLTTRAWYSNTFWSIHIGVNGIDPTPVISHVGQDTFTSLRWVKFSPDGQHLVGASVYPKKGIEIFDFDGSTGKLSNPQFLPLQTEPSNIPYAFEFSPSGRFVYLSTTGYVDPQTGSSWIAPLFQFDLENPNSPPFLVKNLKRPVHELKRAPNGKIYGSLGGYKFYYSLDVIHNPNGKNETCQYQEDGLPIVTFLGADFLPFTLPVEYDLPYIHFQPNSTDTICSFENLHFPYQIGMPSCGLDTIQWSLEGIPGQISFNALSAQVQYFAPGSGRLIVNAHTPCGIAADTLEVLVVPPLNKTLDLGPDRVVCDNGVLTLNAGGGFARYQWNDGSADSTFTIYPPGKYWVNVLDLCGNFQTDTININVAPNSKLDLGPDLPQQCAGFTASYQRPGFFDSWHWSPADFLSCTDCPGVNISPTASATWVVVAQTTNGCISVDTLSATIRDTLLFSRDTSVCIGQTLALFGAQLPADTTAQFFLPAPGIGCDTLWTVHVLGVENASSELSVTICPNAFYPFNGVLLPADTVAVFHLPSFLACDSIVEVWVNAYPPLNLTLPMDTTIRIGASVLLDAVITGTGTLNFVWSPTDGLSCFTCPDPLANPLDTITYTLAVTDVNGCTIEESVTIRVNEECRIQVPNAFTPNGDGTNDVFRPIMDPCVRTVRQWKIINRWGQTVFEQVNFPATDPQLGWDGNWEGKPQSSDVYIWVAEFEYFDGRRETQHGDVTLVR